MIHQTPSLGKYWKLYRATLRYKLKLKVGAGRMTAEEQGKSRMLWYITCCIGREKTILKFTSHLLGVSFCEDDSPTALST